MCLLVSCAPPGTLGFLGKIGMTRAESLFLTPWYRFHEVLICSFTLWGDVMQVLGCITPIHFLSWCNNQVGIP